MSDDTTQLGNLIQIDETQVRGRLSELARGSVEETLNGLLDAHHHTLAVVVSRSDFDWYCRIR
jgi:hypothetical protein